MIATTEINSDEFGRKSTLTAGDQGKHLLGSDI